MSVLLQNIFNLRNPEDYYCAIKGYRYNHSMMLVRVGKNEIDSGVFYIIFSEVAYFEGVFKWKGADFSEASKDELREFLMYLGYENDLQEYLHLFIAEQTSGPTIRVLAARAEKISDIPGGFHWLKDTFI